MKVENKAAYGIRRGNPLPLGVSKFHNGVNFAVSVPYATECILILLHKTDPAKNSRITMSKKNQVGTVFCIYLSSFDYESYEYLYEANGKCFLDPYARIVRGKEEWGRIIDNDCDMQIRCDFSFDSFDWKDDKPYSIPYHDLILYKVHVRGFTKHPSAKLNRSSGTFDGIVKKIPYLKELGINALLIMPLVEFDEILIDDKRLLRNDRLISKERIKYQYVNVTNEIDDVTNATNQYMIDQPSGGAKSFDVQAYQAKRDSDSNTVIVPYKLNYWGYSKQNYYFAPKAAYASDSKNPVRELKNMIYELHKAGIEVHLEFCFTPDTNRQLILDCLRYWFFEYHVDGFLVNNNVVPADLVASDPILARTKLFATSWNIPTGSKEDTIDERNLAEYNDGFMVDCRRFLKGDEGQVNPYSFRFRRNPKEYGVINYITNNNGFTLMDLVSYDIKHNQLNREDNLDGTEYNYSWNCGVEGKSRKKKVIELRRKQIRNALLMLFLSQGTPMILAGDEFGNSQDGNNNAYCQDNTISWLNWNQLKTNDDIFTFMKELIELRKQHGILHQATECKIMDYLSCGCPDMSFHGTKAWYPDFSNYSRVFSAMLCGKYAKLKNGSDDHYFYIAFNMHWEKHEFDLPQLPSNQSWKVLIDTQNLNEDWFVQANHANRYQGKEKKSTTSQTEKTRSDKVIEQKRYEVAARTIAVLISDGRDNGGKR
ncbi:MAG TPA: alpha-amylase [Lachnospiraceae bacterium]|nr:alpha-amylase [Lachnospiraceae bacterium]